MKKFAILALAVFCIVSLASEVSAHGPQQFRSRSFRSFRGPSLSLNFGSRNFRHNDNFNDGFRQGFRAAQQQQFRQFQFRGHHN